MKFDLKVFINKRNGQPVVSLPKKLFKIVPATIKFEIPPSNINKDYKKREPKEILQW